jgi:polysaccharide biosynthesis/export protein
MYAGFTTFELSDKIKEEIRDYVRDAIVNVRILNFKISVLGEVRGPGTFTIEDNHLSLPQALGLAGDLTIFGKRENVLVMREVNGQQVNTYLDLTDPNVVSSPYFNLQQNDVVYVEPKVARVQSASTLQLTSRYLSIASVITSLVILFTR